MCCMKKKLLKCEGFYAFIDNFLDLKLVRASRGVIKKSGFLRVHRYRRIRSIVLNMGN